METPAALMSGLGGDAVPVSAVWKRLATTAVLLPLVVWLVLRGPAPLFAVLVVALSAASAWELGRMFERAGAAGVGWLGVALAAVVTASFLVEGASSPVLAGAILVTLAAPLAKPGTPATSVTAARLFGLTYVGWLLGHAIPLRALPDGGDLVLFLVGVTWVGESAAYAIGSTVGRHRLAPVVSPRKTVEGAVAQLCASPLAAVLLGLWLVPGWSVARSTGAGLLLGIVGQIGDLAESVIKRTAGTKDTGGLIPGHGGVLDRLDSLLFNAPVLFYFVTLGGLGR